MEFGRIAFFIVWLDHRAANERDHGLQLVARCEVGMHTNSGFSNDPLSDDFFAKSLSSAEAAQAVDLLLLIDELQREATVSDMLSPRFYFAATLRLQFGIMDSEPLQADSDSVVFVVEDDPGVRDGIRDLLDSLGIQSQSFESCERFLQHWHDGATSCLILDVQLPGMSGLDLQQRLATQGSHLPIIFMTAHADVPMVRRVMKAGAVDFLIKPINTEDLIQAIESSLARDRARRMRDATRKVLKERLASLSQQQREVLRHVTKGLLNKQIAAEMSLSEITVKQYRRQVMEKMHAQSVAQLTEMISACRGQSDSEL